MAQVPVFDFYSDSEKHSYDVISQGVMIDKSKQPEHDGKVVVNFGGIFIKSSEAGKAVAKHARTGMCFRFILFYFFTSMNHHNRMTYRRVLLIFIFILKYNSS